jgi:hypothetical protein
MVMIHVSSHTTRTGAGYGADPAFRLSHDNQLGVTSPGRILNMRQPRAVLIRI